MALPVLLLFPALTAAAEIRFNLFNSGFTACWSSHDVAGPGGAIYMSIGGPAYVESLFKTSLTVAVVPADRRLGLEPSAGLGIVWRSGTICCRSACRSKQWLVQLSRR